MISLTQIIQKQLSRAREDPDEHLRVEAQTSLRAIVRDLSEAELFTIYDNMHAVQVQELRAFVDQEKGLLPLSSQPQ